MSKKAVVILSVLAIVLAAASGVMVYLLFGKIDAAVTALKPVDEFADKPKVAEHPFTSRLGAPAKAASKLAEVRADNVAKQQDIESKASKIASQTKTIAERDASIDDLNTKNTQLTRERDDFQGKVAGLTSDLSTSKNKVAELETAIAKQTEEFNKQREDLEKKAGSDKTELYAELQRTREYYVQTYNFASGRGLRVPLGAEPWSVQNKKTGPVFAPKTFVAQVIGFDARQGIVVVNVGAESGLLRDQTFELLVGGKSVGKVSVSASPNGSVSALAFSSDSTVPSLTIGTPVKLQTFVGEAAPEQAPAAAASAPAAK